MKNPIDALPTLAVIAMLVLPGRHTAAVLKACADRLAKDLDEYFEAIEEYYENIEREMGIEP